MSNEKKFFHYPKEAAPEAPAKDKDKTDNFFKFPVDADPSTDSGPDGKKEDEDE